MSTVAFLSAEASDQAIARSPMERFARAAGARFEKRSGWNVAVDYGGGVGRRAQALAREGALCHPPPTCEAPGPPTPPPPPRTRSGARRGGRARPGAGHTD